LSSNLPSEQLDLKHEVVRFCHKTFNRGLVAAAGGNISVRIPGRDEMLITRTNVSLGDATPDDIVRVDLDGRVIEAARAARPSKETPFHSWSYKLRPDVQAVIHLHPPYTVVQSLRLKPLPLVTVSARLGLGHVPCVPIAYSGTPKLHGYVRDAVQDNPGVKVIMLAAHGLTAMGVDLTAAFNAADLCEMTAMQACIAEGLGIHVQLPDPHA
jgi:L-ribulose-5-phosphate 4-epimerase